MKKIVCYLGCLFLIFSLTSAGGKKGGNLHMSCKGQKEILYVGTMDQRESKGIYVYEYNRATNIFTLLQTNPEIRNPNFLVIHPGGKYLYAVNTVRGNDGKSYEAISSFAINKTNGTLKLINQKPTYGKAACHISIDHKGRWLYVSHYSSGNLAVFPVKDDGSVGDTIQFIQDSGSSVHQRQKGPFVHSSLVSPDNKFLYVADLGIDKVMIFNLDQNTGRLIPAVKPFGVSKPGSGPRHFTFHPSNSFLYLAEELSNAVTVFSEDKTTGALTPVQTLSTLPEGFTDKNTVADIHTDPSGKFMYVSNRGHNSLAIYSVLPDGKLRFIGHESVLGDHPRNFMIDHKGEFVLVANMNSDSIVSFSLDKSTGRLKSNGLTLSLPAPCCLKWLTL